MDPQEQSVSLACLQLAAQYESDPAEILAVAAKYRAFIDRGGRAETQGGEQ